MAAKAATISVRDGDDLNVVFIFSSRELPGKTGKKKPAVPAAGCEKVFAYLVREIRRCAATRLAGLISQTTTFQHAACGACCEFRMAAFTNIEGGDSEKNGKVSMLGFESIVTF